MITYAEYLTSPSILLENVIPMCKRNAELFGIVEMTKTDSLLSGLNSDTHAAEMCELQSSREINSQLFIDDAAAAPQGNKGAAPGVELAGIW